MSEYFVASHRDELLRENRQLKERIKTLEQELMEVKNKHSVLVADVVLNEDRAERIKRLEEAGDGLLTALKDDWSEYVEWINESTDAVGKWKRAKEAKP